jgi:uncharacterized membrane protein YccF (DUF307 family)
MLVGSLCGLLLSPLQFILHVGTYEGSYIGAGLFWVLVTGQWLMVGHFLQERLWPKSY